MDRAVHDTAHTRDPLRCVAHRDNASRCTHNIHNVTSARARTDGIPVGVEGPDRKRNPWTEAEFRGPFCIERAGHLVAGFIASAESGAHALEERIHGDKKLLGWQSAEIAGPQPFVAHRTDG